MTDLTQEALAGRAVPIGAAKENPHLFSSAAWFGFEAGYAVRGLCDVSRARMSRGYSVRIETVGGNTIIVTFDGRNFDKVTTNRLG